MFEDLALCAIPVVCQLKARLCLAFVFYLTAEPRDALEELREDAITSRTTSFKFCILPAEYELTDCTDHRGKL